MKTKVLKLLALSAMMLVPIGAGAFDAVTLDFGTQETVSKTKTWTFNGLAATTTYTSNQEVNGGYIRANASNDCTVTALGSAQTITFADGYTTSVSNVLTFTKKWASYSTTVSSANGTSSQISCFAINVECAGKLYVAATASEAKQVRANILYQGATEQNLNQASTLTDGIAYLSADITGKAVVTLGNLSSDNYVLYAVRFVPTPSVSNATTWTFNNYETSASILTVAPHFDGTGLWVRGYEKSETTKPVNISSFNKEITFSDGSSVTITKAATATTGISENPSKGNATSSAGRPSFAFNTTVPGTIMAKVADKSNCRIYFGDGTETANSMAQISASSSGSEGDYELTYTSISAGTFVFGRASSAFTLYGLRFVPTHTLTKTATNGTITANIEELTSGYNNYNEGTELTLTATPDAGYRFDSWSGDVETINGNTATVTMSVNKTVTANFVQIFALTTNATNGSVTRSPDAATYDTGTSVALTATPADGYKFTSWSGDIGDATATNNPITVTMDQARTITASFAKASLVTKWTFEEYVDGVNMFGTATSQAVKEYADGLYLHTRDADSENYRIVTGSTTIAPSDITSQTKTYKNGETYTGIIITSGNNTVNATDASANVSCTGFSYQAPAAGTLYYTFYTTNRTHVYTYKNATSAPNDVTIDPGSADGKGQEFSLEVAANDVVYVTVSGTNGTVFLLDVLFVPTSLDATSKIVSINANGYATFSSIYNYTMPNGLTAYYVSNVDTENKKATMSPINAGSVIPACTGVILYKEGGGSVTLNTAGKTAAVSTNYLKANIVDYDLPANDGTNYNYTLAYDGEPVFKHSSGTGTLAAGKAFLRTELNVTDEARLAMVFDDGETTGINEVSSFKIQDSGSDSIYNLSGQSVGSDYKGIVIKNGKKYIVK